MAEAVERTDELVREYLLFRGFTHTLRQLDAEIKADKEKGFRVDKIVEQLQQLMQVYDLAALRDYWSYLERRLFSRLEDIYRPTIHKLKTSLFRFYLVYTIQTNRNDKAQEFFTKQAAELQNQAEWKDWFALPFLPSPDTNPTFATYFSRQWADTFIVSLHNFLSVLFQCMPVPVILNFDAECQRTSQVQEENEVLRQKLFALQAEVHRLKKEEPQPEEGEAVVQHKLPPYVSNMDRLGDSELAMVSSQRHAALSQSPRVGFLSSLLPQSKKSPSRLSPAQGTLQTQSMAKKESSSSLSAKSKEPACGPKDTKSLFSGLASGESSWSQHRQRRLQDHGKERKELLSTSLQGADRKPEAGGAEVEPCVELHVEAMETLMRVPTAGPEGGAGRPEQPFIVLGQEEYGEHHSSIMHCRVDCSGRRVASLDVDGVIKVWSFNPTMQTKASSISKSPLLSLEWATKRDRLLLLGSGVGTVRLYDTEAKKNLCEININEDMPRILSLACSPSGASFVCSAAAAVAPSLASQVDTSGLEGGRSTPQVPGRLLLWDTKSMKQQLQFSLDPEPIAINCTAFNHNGNLLVTGAADGVIRLFDMQQHECAMSWQAHCGEVYSVEFSYDENTVYSIGEDGKFIQWNIHKSGQKVSEYGLPADATGPFVLSGYSGYKQVQVPRGRLFAFDSEGNYMLTCSATGGVIYKLGGDEKVLESCLSLGGHRAPVVTVDWSTAMDCGICLTASMDGKIKLTTLLAHKV
ncbi:WD repeat-containing protein 91 [Sorex fumeus]|uniref:WD repeat-containing protein 91 n=1 Tax=Sorex fumeus TaxID=62283 RepID=UPI0024AE6CEF|nr:WD repeat-containing protein 91 [Sorex fumeus]